MSGTALSFQGGKKTRIGRLIELAIYRQNLGLAGIAAKVGVSAEYVERVLRSQWLPSMTVLEDLCMALDIPWDTAREACLLDKEDWVRGGLRD